ncbi:hypothetical protein [Rhodococcus tibetensis]|uniref:Uncharacterized protein n=1 Tax=Rhodococcus tibetensis TaxID=2965064 RepID=A0ABT1Q9I9_9NOCA|nr:hypothetical protein [Rhodococcus sp. FXJ9.536]MCQ4118926.1 hypothetical protein [Rhodococcus sp. FXJ9.536]
MSWDEYHRRAVAIDAVLEQAARTGQTSLPFFEVPEASAIFESESALLAALEAKWSTLYGGFLEQETFAAETSGANRIEIARRAWARADAAKPFLRNLIDHNAVDGKTVMHSDGKERGTPTGGLKSSALTVERTESDSEREAGGFGSEIAAGAVLLAFFLILWSLL